MADDSLDRLKTANPYIAHEIFYPKHFFRTGL